MSRAPLRSAPLVASPNRISLLLRTARYLAEIESLSSPLIYASLAGEARGSIDPVAAEPSRRNRVTPPDTMLSFLSQLSLLNKMRVVNPNETNQNAVRFSRRRCSFRTVACFFITPSLAFFFPSSLALFTSSLALFTTLFALFTTLFALFRNVIRFSENRSLFRNIVRFSRISFAFFDFFSFSFRGGCCCHGKVEVVGRR